MLSVVIPSRNGAALLRRYLPPVLRESRGLGEVVVVDDGSTDDTGQVLSEFDYRNLRRVSRAGGPNGFCYTVNRGMEEAEGDLLLLLNNDVEPERGAFRALVRAAEQADERTYALVPSIVRPDGTEEGGCVVRMTRGLPRTSMSGPGIPYPSGACSLFPRRAWERLGGLSTRFAPIYWEDVDLGLRAREMGMRLARVPGSVVNHQHAATMGRTLESEILRERNRLLLADTSPLPAGWRAMFRLWLPYHLLMAGLRGNRAFRGGYRQWRAMECEGE